MRKKQIKKLTLKEIDSGVKIQGTPFDRKRKLSLRQIKKMQKMFNKKIPVSRIAKKFNVSILAVKYNCDFMWALNFNNTRNGKHYGENKITMRERVDYKRNLLLRHKVKYIGLTY